MASTRSKKPEHLTSPPWWINPSWISASIVFPLVVATLLVSSDFHSYFGRPIKFFTIQSFLIGTVGLCCFMLGACLGSTVRIARAPTRSLANTNVHEHAAQIVVASRALLVLTLAAYLLYLWPLAANPRVLVQILSGAPGAQYLGIGLRESVRTPGVTSLTQLGIVYVVLFIIRLLYLRSISITTAERISFSALIALALLRSVAYSERLAILELLVPISVLLFRRTRFSWAFVAFLPLFGVLGLFAFFAVLEYFRSWQNHYQYLNDDFVSFALERFFGYYLNALDTGAGFLRYLGGGVGPVLTFEWLWAFPINFGQDSILRSLSFDTSSYTAFLHHFASPEFNNGSGLFAPFIDYGVAGGAICWCVLGYVSGALFRSYIRGGFVGLLVYPSWYTSIVEIPRVFNFGSTRYFLALVVSLGIALWIRGVCFRYVGEAKSGSMRTLRDGSSE